MVNFLLLATTLVFSASIQAQTFKSPTKKATLIELYTSQGCSSCPPAEVWLSKLKEKPTLWQDIIPVAFHVDYWDYLGWKDPFAKKAYSTRQQEYRLQRKTTAVYTPGFVTNGKQWNGWRLFAIPHEPKKAGVLSATLNDKQLTASYSDFFPTYTLNIAILGFGIQTPVHAGENKGETLPQDFVVLHHQTIKPENKQWHATLPNYKKKSVERYGVALWLQNDEDLLPLQATGGWLQ